MNTKPQVCNRCKKIIETPMVPNMSNDTFTCQPCIEKDLTKRIIENVSKLKELEKNIVKAFLDNNDYNTLHASLVEFSSVTHDIKVLQMELPLVTIYNDDHRSILRDIYRDDNPNLISNRLLQFLKDEVIIGHELTIDDLYNDGLDSLLYNTITPYGYAKALFEIGSLKLNVAFKHNDLLRYFITEIRECYALQRYTALYGLCRTIVEVSTRDICLRKRLFRDKVVDFDKYSISRLIDKVSHTNSHLETRLNTIREKTNPLLHGRKQITPEEAMTLFKDTIEVVEDLYSFHFKG